MKSELLDPKIGEVDGAAVVLEGQRVLPERLLRTGFLFDAPDLTSALAAATTPAPR